MFPPRRRPPSLGPLWIFNVHLPGLHLSPHPPQETLFSVGIDESPSLYSEPLASVGSSRALVDQRPRHTGLSTAQRDEFQQLPSSQHSMAQRYQYFTAPAMTGPDRTGPDRIILDLPVRSTKPGKLNRRKTVLFLFFLSFLMNLNFTAGKSVF